MPPKEIVFPDVPPPRYLFERDCISFPAWVDGKPVNCVVTAELLMQRFGLRTLDEEAMLEAYRQNRECIQAIARFYIEMGWIGPDHEVLLTRRLTTVRVTYGEALRAWGEGFRLAENTSRRLTEMIGPMAGEVSFEWDRAEGPSNRPVITLKISNPFGTVSASTRRRWNPPLTCRGVSPGCGATSCRCSPASSSASCSQAASRGEMARKTLTATVNELSDLVARALPHAEREGY